MFSRLRTPLRGSRRFSSSPFSVSPLQRDPLLPLRAMVPSAILLTLLALYKNYSKLKRQEEEEKEVREEILTALRKIDDDKMENKSQVKQQLKDSAKENMAPGLLRLLWCSASTYSRHDSLGGVDGSLRLSPKKDWKANKGLDRIRSVLTPIKERHPDMSHADLWSLAAVVALESLGGPVVPWVSGRVDVQEDTQDDLSESRCPVTDSGSIEADIDHIKVLFGRIGGLSYRHIVALFGAHSVGRCHEEVSGYSGSWTSDENTFNNEYFKRLLTEKWSPKGSGSRQYRNEDGSLTMLPIDMALIHDPEFREIVKFYAENEEEFRKDFAFAFEKLINAGVEHLTVKRGFASRIAGL